MAFQALRFDTRGELAERWADALLDAGALSVDVAEAAAEGARGNAADGVPCDWSRARVSALCESTAQLAALMAVAAGAMGEPVPDYGTDSVSDTDWVRATQAQFPPIQVTDRLWIVPSWCEPVDRQAVNIRLDPGLAFGTGSHPTTRLCLRWLAENVSPGASVLDYGCGSGVLAIAAAKLGAATVSGLDSDPVAVGTSRANAETNGVQATFGLPGELPAAKVDVVVANILANPLELLAPLLAERVAPRGHIVLSGILESQADGVAEAYRRWFNIDVWGRECGWVALVGMRSR